MGFTLAYELDGILYLNVTNRCYNNCTFCIRKNEKGVGYDLWLDKEPTAKEILEAAGDVSKYEEIVFCGYGEPLLRPDIVETVSKKIKKQSNAKLRINTNGLAEKVLDLKFLEDLSGLIDIISISLNAHNAETYYKLSQPSVGSDAFDHILEFARRSKKYIPRVILTVVNTPEVDIEQCRRIAQDIDAEFRVRPHLT